ncbi:MAG TPA: N-acetyl-gamma-glutamyl-phosphate reductase [Candidatus Polarisedimenticolaceae bacterium]|nr:N-acetyl-gamma-glutamyl-phosphate reductase [Candidatus Polarisedimenticolaceae bacterium]
MIPAAVLGGSGYVAGELLRLLSGHPAFHLEAVVSRRLAGSPVTDRFLHLRGTVLEGLAFSGDDGLRALVRRSRRLAVFSALPHGEAAAQVDALLAAASAAGCEAHVVDLSADFRHRDPARYAALYGKPHAAPARLPEFVCALPEHVAGIPAAHVAHPGCFTTAATLALVPLLARGFIEPRATVVAVTGSTGAGGTPTPTTHHPERRSDLYAYAADGHRHEPEMRALAAAAAGNGHGREPAIHFVPHSGPFARGIHATVCARLTRAVSADDVRAAAADFYGASAAFVRVLPSPPRLQAVVGTNRCDLSFTTRDGEVLAFAALDNLVKGAAGGGLQWMNRLFGLPESAGLALAGLGWL